MQREIEIVVPAQHTDWLLERLQPLDTVVGLAVWRGGSLKPAGDLIKVQSLNRDADSVLRIIEDLRGKAEFSVGIAELSALIDTQQQEAITDDSDDSLWEEIETGLRQTVQITANYCILMALGGVLAASGYCLTGTPQSIAFVSASIIAPGFEPIAKCPLGLVLSNRRITIRALRSFIAGYAVLIGAAALGWLLLNAVGGASIPSLRANPQVIEMFHPSAPNLLVSMAGAVAGMIIVVTYRDVVMAGPLIALALIPAASLVGVGVAALQPDMAWAAVKRFGLDVLLVFVAGMLIVWFKQRSQHQRKPIM